MHQTVVQCNDERTKERECTLNPWLLLALNGGAMQRRTKERKIGVNDESAAKISPQGYGTTTCTCLETWLGKLVAVMYIHLNLECSPVKSLLQSVYLWSNLQHQMRLEKGEGTSWQIQRKPSCCLCIPGTSFEGNLRHVTVWRLPSLSQVVLTI